MNAFWKSYKILLSQGYKKKVKKANRGRRAKLNIGDDTVYAVLHHSLRFLCVERRDKKQSPFPKKDLQKGRFL